MCARPAAVRTLFAGGHAGPPLRSTGTSYKTPKTFDSAVREGAFHGISKTFHYARVGGRYVSWNVKNVPLCPCGRPVRFMKFKKRSVLPVGAHLCVRPPRRRAGFRTEQRRRKAAALCLAASLRRRPDRPAKRLSERFKLNQVGIARSSVRQTAGNDNVVALLGHAGVFGGDDRVVKKHVGGLKLLAHHRLDAP